MRLVIGLLVVVLLQAGPGPCPMDRLTPGHVCLKDALELDPKDLKKGGCPICGGPVIAVEFCHREQDGKTVRSRVGTRCRTCGGKADVDTEIRHAEGCGGRKDPPAKHCILSGRPPHATSK